MSQRAGRLLAILDGKPNALGQNRSQRGQSLVELALVMPILILLVMGLAEVGWFANNFLILLEVTRAGARYGTAQPLEQSPLTWNNTFTIAGSSTAADESRDCTQITENLALQGFYNSILCVMLQALDPLTIDTTNGIDDIVISVFSFKNVIPNQLSFSFYNTATAPSALLSPALTRPTVVTVGRYPTNANECGLWAERDPFDYFVNDQRDYRLYDGALGDTLKNRNYLEQDGWDAANPSELQLGWVYTGQHKVEETYSGVGDTSYCIGSEWHSSEAQDLMNLANFSMSDADRERIPDQGLILVEIFWQHELLLKNPIFNPVFKFFGGETATISVWAAFPISSTEPRITYP